MSRLSPLFGVLLVACSAEVRQGTGDAETCDAECSLEDGSGGGRVDDDNVVADGGSGGYIGTAEGAGGANGTVVECTDHEVPLLPEWQPAGPPPDTSPSDQLTAARQALGGTWHGVVTTPWMAPYEVLASFQADGGYSAHCLYDSDNDGDDVDGCCRAFYYGSDLDSELKQWRLEDVSANGTFSGEIDIAFCYEGEECYLPSWQGEVDDLQFDATGDRLRFEFRHDGYGPVTFDLERVR